MGTLLKEIIADRIEILEDGQIQVRMATRITEDGKTISQVFHRYVIEPGGDVTEECQRVKDVCQTIHTTETVDKYMTEKAKKAAAMSDGLIKKTE